MGQEYFFFLRFQKDLTLRNLTKGSKDGLMDVLVERREEGWMMVDEETNKRKDGRNGKEKKK